MEVRKRIAIVLVLVWLVKWINGCLLNQMQEPAFLYPDVEKVYWFLFLWKVPQFLWSQPVLLWILDVIYLILLIIWGIRDRKWLNLTMPIVFIFYHLMGNVAFMQHWESWIGSMWIIIAFLPQNLERRQFLWDWVRLYACLAFVWAAGFKWSRGAWADEGQMHYFLFQQFLPEFAHWKAGGIFTSLHSFLLGHGSILTWLYRIGMILESIFIIGFFTKKFDKALLASFIVLVLSFGVVMDIWVFAFEYLPLGLAFMPLETKR